MLPLTRDKAISLMTSNISNIGLQMHCLAVGFAMKGLAQHFGAKDADLWEIAGILHDADWEIMKDDVKNHTRRTVEWIEANADQNSKEETAVLIRTILSHNCHNNDEPHPSNDREWSLYCCDELTGLIIATTRVMPSKKISDVTVESVIKKMNSKNFAAAVDRGGIRLCEEKLSLPLAEFVSIVLKSMQKGATELGL